MNKNNPKSSSDSGSKPLKHTKATKQRKTTSKQSASSSLLTKSTHNFTTNTTSRSNFINIALSPTSSQLNFNLPSLLTPFAPLRTTTRLKFSTQQSYHQDGGQMNLQAGPATSQTIQLSQLKPEYLRERPEIAMRARFNRIPTREEVTGLTPDPQRDAQKFQFPGQKKLREDNMLPVRDDKNIKFIDKVTTQETLKIALNHSSSKLSESLLSLAIAEPVAYNPNSVLDAADANIIAQLAIAPSWDVDNPKEEQLKQLMQVKSSERIYQGQVGHSLDYLDKRFQEAEENNLPYFKPTGNVQIDEMNKRNLQKGILPMPNFAENQDDITPDDLTHIDAMAQTIFQHIEISTTAKQSYDTASKIVSQRLQDLPADPNTFFPNAGCPTIQSRNHQAYSRYLKLVSHKGTITQALDIYDEIRTRGMSLTQPIYHGLLACLKNKHFTELETHRMVKEMLVNKPNLDKTATYTGLTDYVFEKTHITILPKSTKRPLGAPEGFVSCAPQIATYGSPRLRGAFNPAVEYAFYIFEQAKQNGTIPSKHLVSALMAVCGKHKQYERAFALFEEFKRYANGSMLDPKLASNRKELMLAQPHTDAKLEGFEPDQTMATVLMSACHDSGRYDLVEETFHRFWEEGLQPDAPMYNLVINSCAYGGNVEKAFKYFEQLQHFGHTPSIITYSSLIRACSSPSRPEFYSRAFEVFHECISAGFRPDHALFSDLLRSASRQGHVHNLISIFRVMNRDFPHLISISTYTAVANGIATSMNNESLPGFGGYVLTRTGRTLFGSTLSGDKDENAQITSSPKIKLTREDRLAMIDALYSEVMLRLEAQDRTGSKHGAPLRIDSQFISAIVRGYAYAAGGILLWDRHERKEGREDPMLRLTSEHIDQLIERTWGKVVTLQQQHPHIFQLDGSTYQSLFQMYGAADRMDDAVYHLLYLVRGLKIIPPRDVWQPLLEQCRANAHHGPALIIIKEMDQHGIAVSAKDRTFFNNRENESEQPIVPNSFPSLKPHKDDRENQWQQPHRDVKTGKMVNHPQDFNVSWKDF